VSVSRRAGHALTILPTALALVAEAAWVTIVAGMLQAFTLHPPTLGYPWFLLVATAGLVAARALEARAAERTPTIIALLAVATGAIGWLASPDVRAILAERGPGGVGPAIIANIGGWLGAVAFVRGVAHARLPADPYRIGNMLGIAIPGLAAIAILGGMVAEPSRGRFLGEAQGEAIVFLLAGITALALARLGLVATGAAVDWRRNPAWLALLVVLLGGTAVLAIVVSIVAGPFIVMGLGAVLTPLLIVGFFVGFDRRSFMILLLSILGTAAVAAVLQFFAARNAAPPPTPPTGGLPADQEVIAATPVALGVLGIVLGVAIIAVLVLARLWLRRPRDEEPEVPETREIDRGEWDTESPSRRRGRWSRRPEPRDAAAAYRALLEELEAYPALRRQPGETPVEHAARLRRAGSGALALELLAADYGLARFGALDLTPREHRRALARAKSLPRRLPSS
jgi:multisubunit Na+/H+ antiporter MnhC subunit